MYTSSSKTVVLNSSSGELAGGLATDPSAMSNLLPWHLQLMVPSLTDLTFHPSCVQVLVKAL